MSWAAEREKEMKKQQTDGPGVYYMHWPQVHFAKIRPLVFSRVTITAFALPAKRSDKTT